MSGSISSSQFQAVQPDMTPPLSLSKATTGSAAQGTAWRTSSVGKGVPAAYSSRTKGTTLNWDDAPATALPQSDKGAGRSQNG